MSMYTKKKRESFIESAETPILNLFTKHDDKDYYNDKNTKC